MVGILVVVGAGCLLGAAVGRRVKVRRKGGPTPGQARASLVRSRRARLLLAGVGAACLGAGVYLGGPAGEGRAGPSAAAVRPAGPAGSSDSAATRTGDPLAGVWRTPDGSTMRFRRSGDGYDVESSKPSGFTDVGTATLKGVKVDLSFKNKYVGSYTGELTLAGDELKGSYLVSGVRIPAELRR